MNAFLRFFIGKKIFQKPFELMHLISIYGMNYGNGGNFAYSGEKYTAEYIKSKILLQKGQGSFVIFDVGANSGHYSQEIAEVFEGENYTIHAFEPSKLIYKSMQHMLSVNKRIISNNIALGEKKDVLNLYAEADYSGLASVYQRRLEHANITMSHVEEIAIDTIDNYCKANNIGKINFLKMDIEGHEYKCLLGAAEMLKNKSIDFIQFEFGGCNIDSRTFLQDFWYLLHKDYNLYRIVANGLIPLKAYKERLEIFKSINYLAERKGI